MFHRTHKNADLRMVYLLYVFLLCLLLCLPHCTVSELRTSKVSGLPAKLTRKLRVRDNKNIANLALNGAPSATK